MSELAGPCYWYPGRGIVVYDGETDEQAFARAAREDTNRRRQQQAAERQRILRATPWWQDPPPAPVPLPDGP